MNPLSKIYQYIQAHRYGQTGISGLNELENNAKMITVIVAPFMSVWFGIQYLIAIGTIPREDGPLFLILSIVGWGFYCVGFWAYVTTNASKYKCLPQATCFFPDGGDRKFTFPIKPDGITKRCEWKDGSIGVEIEFINRYMYQSVNMDFPYVFDSALMRIPADIGETFKFNSLGEFWHKGMIVETSNCEHVSYYVFEWIREKDKWKPVGMIIDCTFNYQKALEKYRDPSEEIDMHEADTYFMLYKQALTREDELNQYTETLEEAHSVALRRKGKGVKKAVDDVLEMARSGVHDIGEVRESTFKRIFKLGNILTFVVVLAVGAWLLSYLGWI